MTATVLARPGYPSRASDLIYELRNDPQLMELVERGMKARIEGRVKPWSRVKKELGI